MMAASSAGHPSRSSAERLQAAAAAVWSDPSNPIHACGRALVQVLSEEPGLTMLSSRLGERVRALVGRQTYESLGGTNTAGDRPLPRLLHHLAWCLHSAYVESASNTAITLDAAALEISAANAQARRGTGSSSGPVAGTSPTGSRRAGLMADARNSLPHPSARQDLSPAGTANASTSLNVLDRLPSTPATSSLHDSQQVVTGASAAHPAHMLLARAPTDVLRFMLCAVFGHSLRVSGITQAHLWSSYILAGVPTGPAGPYSMHIHTLCNVLRNVSAPAWASLCAALPPAIHGQSMTAAALLGCTRLLTSSCGGCLKVAGDGSDVAQGGNTQLKMAVIQLDVAALEAAAQSFAAQLGHAADSARMAPPPTAAAAAAHVPAGPNDPRTVMASQAFAGADPATVLCRIAAAHLLCLPKPAGGSSAQAVTMAALAHHLAQHAPNEWLECASQHAAQHAAASASHEEAMQQLLHHILGPTGAFDFTSVIEALAPATDVPSAWAAPSPVPAVALNLRGLLGRALVQQEAPAPPPTTAPHADRERVQSLSYAQVAESLAAKPAGPTIHAAGPGPQHQPHASPMHVYEWGGGNVHGTVAPTALSGLVAAPGAQVKMVEAMTRCVIRGDSPLAKLRRCAVQCLVHAGLERADGKWTMSSNDLGQALAKLESDAMRALRQEAQTGRTILPMVAAEVPFFIRKEVQIAKACEAEYTLQLQSVARMAQAEVQHQLASNPALAHTPAHAAGGDDKAVALLLQAAAEEQALVAACLAVFWPHNLPLLAGVLCAAVQPLCSVTQGPGTSLKILLSEAESVVQRTHALHAAGKGPAPPKVPPGGVAAAVESEPLLHIGGKTKAGGQRAFLRVGALVRAIIAGLHASTGAVHWPPDLRGLPLAALHNTVQPTVRAVGAALTGPQAGATKALWERYLMAFEAAEEQGGEYAVTQAGAWESRSEAGVSTHDGSVGAGMEGDEASALLPGGWALDASAYQPAGADEEEMIRRAMEESLAWHAADSAEAPAARAGGELESTATAVATPSWAPVPAATASASATSAQRDGHPAWGSQAAAAMPPAAPPTAVQHATAVVLARSDEAGQEEDENELLDLLLGGAE